METSSPCFKKARAKFDQCILTYGESIAEIRALLFKRGLNNKEANYALQTMAKDTWENRNGGTKAQYLVYRGTPYIRTVTVVAPHCAGKNND